MLTKTILLYDAKNAPLRVKGIRVELFDATTGVYITGDDSKNLDQTKPEFTSDEWGVELTFTQMDDPLDIMIQDPAYRYPGNMMRSLNGELKDLVYIDLLALPTRAGGQAAPLRSGAPGDLIAWVESGHQWSTADKDAVYNLVFNYLRMIAARSKVVETSAQLRDTAANWAKAMEALDIDAGVLLKPTQGSGTPQNSQRLFVEDLDAQEHEPTVHEQALREQELYEQQLLEHQQLEQQRVEQQRVEQQRLEQLRRAQQQAQQQATYLKQRY